MSPPGPAPSVEPTLSQGPTRPAGCSAPPLGPTWDTLLREVGQRAEQAFRSPLPQSAAALLAAGQDAFFAACCYVWLSPRSAYNKREPETLPGARQTPAGRWGPVAAQEAPCPEALSPSPLGPRRRPALPLPGTPSLAGGRADARPASLLRPQLSLEKQRLPLCEGQTRFPNHEDGEIRAFY